MQENLEHLLCYTAAHERHLKLARFWLQTATKVLAVYPDACKSSSSASLPVFQRTPQRTKIPNTQAVDTHIVWLTVLSLYVCVSQPASRDLEGEELSTVLLVRESVWKFIIPRITMCGVTAFKLALNPGNHLSMLTRYAATFGLIFHKRHFVL